MFGLRVSLHGGDAQITCLMTVRVCRAARNTALAPTSILLLLFSSSSCLPSSSLCRCIKDTTPPRRRRVFCGSHATTNVNVGAPKARLVVRVFGCETALTVQHRRCRSRVFESIRDSAMSGSIIAIGVQVFCALKTQKKSKNSFQKLAYSKGLGFEGSLWG